MEKLIELLQIYDNRNDTIGDTIQYRIENWNIQRSVKWIDRWVNVWWYSKSFWFIKWLVDNDKIDLEQVEKINQTWSVYIRFWWDYEKVLMLLSINDNHIEFLCEILKDE